MEFDRRVDGTGAVHAIRSVHSFEPSPSTSTSERSTGTPDACASAIREVYQAALAARDLPSTAGCEEKVAVLHWVLRAADQMTTAVAESVESRRSAGYRPACFSA
jgi:hypothetical protein